MTVDGGASAHDAHLDAALADYDDGFTSLQLQTGQLDPVSSGAAAAAAGGVAAAATAPTPMGQFFFFKNGWMKKNSETWA